MSEDLMRAVNREGSFAGLRSCRLNVKVAEVRREGNARDGTLQVGEVHLLVHGR